jgi:hypothetical protein
MLRTLAAVCYALVCFFAGWLLAFIVWAITDVDSAFGTVLGIGELDCNRAGEDCGSWSETMADHWWAIVLGVALAISLALLPWFRSRLGVWLTRWDRPAGG